MRATRGLMASMGAATCLILAGTIVLTLISGVIAFRGWPGAGEQGGGEQQALITEARAAAHVTRTPRLRLPAPRATLASARRTQPSARRTTKAQTAGAPRTGTGTRSPSAPPPAGPPGPEPAGPITSAAPAASPGTGGQGVRRLGQNLGGAVDTAGQVVGKVVAPVAPAAGSTIQQTTQQVGQAVQGVAGVVGHAVDGLGLPHAP